MTLKVERELVEARCAAAGDELFVRSCQLSQRGEINVFRFSVFDDQSDNIRRFQGSGGSAACDLLISFADIQPFCLAIA